MPSENLNDDGLFKKLSSSEVNLLKDQMDSKLREAIQEFINKTMLIPEIDIYVASLSRDESNAIIGGIVNVKSKISR